MKHEALKRKKGGFTLVETIVAIAILVLAVGAPLTLAYQGIASTAFARDQVIATYLAQDAMEAIITQKRQNVLTGDADQGQWLKNMVGCSGGNCKIDSTKIGDNSFTSSCGPGCPLNYDTATGLYNYDNLSVANHTTKFTRLVKIEPAGGGNFEAFVTITVSWKSNIAGIKSFSIRTNIFNTEL